jgi:hypothetical protein
MSVAINVHVGTAAYCQACRVASYACLRRNGGVRRGRNLLLCLDDVPHVEVGVELIAGPVFQSSLPAGEVAATVARIRSRHSTRQSGAMVRSPGRNAGPRQEIYGDWREDPAELETELFHLLP